MFSASPRPHHHKHADQDLETQPLNKDASAAEVRKRRQDRLRKEFRSLVKIFTRVVRTVMVVLQPILITMAIALIGFVVYAYFYHLLPVYTENASFVGHLTAFLFMTCPGLFLLYGILLNYFMCVLTPPGFANNLNQKIPLPSFCDDKGKDQNGVKVYCVTCKIMKPARSHHCSICDKCVLKMDHHCPWVGRCVGYYNHKYFFSFLWYMMFGCSFVTTVSIYPLYTNGIEGDTINFIVALLCFSVWCAMIMLGGFQSLLVFTNQTTIEFYENQKRRYRALKDGTTFKNPYNLGILENIREMFGPQCTYISWLIPPRVQPPPGDGVHFRTRGSRPKAAVPTAIV